MRRLTMLAGALGAALLMTSGTFAQVPADPNNPNENVPDKATYMPYGETIKLADAKKVAEAALAEADRAPGWNNRRPDVRRFTLPGNFGHDCTLYVVPFRRWAYRRIEQQAAQWHREQERSA